MKPIRAKTGHWTKEGRGKRFARTDHGGVENSVAKQDNREVMAQIRAVRVSLEKLETTVSGLDTSVSGLRETTADLRSTIASLATSVTNLGQSVSKLSDATTKTGLDVAEIKGKISNMPSTWQVMIFVPGAIAVLLGLAAWIGKIKPL